MKVWSRTKSIGLALAISVVVASIVGGSYGAWASGLASSNYRWFTANPSADVFTLVTPGDIYSFAEIVNGTQPDTVNGGEPFDFHERTIQIIAGSNPSISDIPAADSTGKAGEMPLNTFGTQYEFEPIGTEQHPFEGTFDGNGAILLNMLIDQEIYGTENLGLFGVVGEHGTVQNFTVTGNITLGTEAPLRNIGGAVGYNRGSIQNVTSQVNLTFDSNYAPTTDPTGTITPVNNLGGVVGYSETSIVGCTYQNARLTLKSDADAVNETGFKADSVAKSIGGVVGTLGSYTTNTIGVSATNCANHSSIYLALTGSGGMDNWGRYIDSKPANVGGVAGYSSGSLYGCANTGEIRTSARGTDSNGRISSIWDAAYDNGASKCGGIVGSLRSDGIEVYAGNANGTTDNGTPDDVLKVEDCWNTGLVIASNNIGGIVGSAGTYTLVTGCSNGNSLADNVSKMGDVDTLPNNQGSIVSTQWNKPFVGGIAGTSKGSISNSYNRAAINCTQGGYYLAGICGGLGIEDLKALSHIVEIGYVSEVYGCYNVGQIGANNGSNNRYGALVGDNNGYVHDCIVRLSCVVAKESNPMGGNLWGRYDNIETYDSAGIKTASATRVLNSRCFDNGSYSIYWFSGKDTGPEKSNYNDGFPVLSSWAKSSSGSQIDASRLEEISVKNALYTNYHITGQEPVPTVELSYYTDSGEVVALRQNGDYLIVPEEGAFARTDQVEDVEPSARESRPYSYSVIGIGNYTGEVLDFGNYGIGAGTLEDMTVVVDSGRKYNYEVQFPESVEVYDASGKALDSSSFSYVIYDSETHNIFSEGAPRYVVFDSEGFVVFDDEIDVKVPADEAISLVNKNDGRTFKVYDSGGTLLSDSDALVYDVFGQPKTNQKVTLSRLTVDGHLESRVTTVGASCLGYVSAVNFATWDNAGDAGYCVEVRGKGDYEGAVQEGKYVIQQPDLEEDCITTVIFPDGSRWRNDTEDGRFDPVGESNIDESPHMTFSGTCCWPTVEVEYLGEFLVAEENTRYSNLSNVCVDSNIGSSDFAVSYGGSEVVDYGNVTPNYLRNRNATDSEDTDYGAAVRIQPTFRNFPYIYNPFGGYLTFEFDIDSVSAENVSVEIAEKMALPTFPDSNDSFSIDSPVTVKYFNEALIEGLDYQLIYRTSDGTLLDGRPSLSGKYSVRIEMLPPNFYGELAISSFEFEVIENAKQFFIETDYRGPSDYGKYPYIASRKGKLDGEYITDSLWDVGRLYPDLRFFDEYGNTITEQLEFGKDYTLDISPAIGGSTGKYLNADYWSGRNEKQPYIEGYSSEVLALFGSTSRTDKPMKIHIEGLGKYAGCAIECYWYLGRIELPQTEIEDWSWELQNPVRGDISNTSANSLPANPWSWVSYKDKLVFTTRYPSSCLVGCRPSSDTIAAGDIVDFVIIAGDGPFTGSMSLPVTREVQPFVMNDLSLEDVTLVYDGSEKQPAVKNSRGYYTCPEDYVVEYAGSIDAGLASCVAVGNYTLTGTGNFAGSYILYYSILPRSMEESRDDLVVSCNDSLVFTGEPLCPKVEIIDDGLAEEASDERRSLVEGKDYELTYAHNTEVGTGLIYITGIGNYSGTIEYTFEIVADESNVRLYTEYVDVLNPARNVQAPTWTDGNKAGETVTCVAPVIEGWHVVPLEEETVTKSIVLSATERNAITFQYLKDGWSLPEEVQDIKLDITVYNTNWYAAAKASVQPTNADQTVLWSTSDVSLAQINSKGYIRAYDDGVVEITAASTRDPEIVGTAQLVIVGQADEPFTMEQSSGVVMDGVPSGSKFVVSRESANSFASKVERGKHVAAAYDVNLYGVEYAEGSDGKKVSTGRADTTLPIQPISTVGLKFPVPNGYNADDIEVLHWAEDGTYELEDAVLSDDGSYLVISTDHLSLFTLVAPDDASSTQAPGNNPGNSGDNKPGSDGPINDGSGHNDGTNNGGTNQGGSVTIGDGDTGTGGKVTIGDGDTGSNVQNPSTNPGNTGSGNSGSGSGNGGTYVAPNLPSTGTTGNNASAGTNNSTGSTGGQQASATTSNVTGSTGSSGSSGSTGSSPSSSRSSSSESGSSASASSSSSSSRSDSSSSSSSSRSSSSSSSSSSKADDKNSTNNDTKQVSDKEVTAKVDGDMDVAQTVGVTLLVLVVLAGASVGVYFTYIKRPRRTTRRWR